MKSHFGNFKTHLYVLFACTILSAAGFAQVSTAERDALVALYNSTGGSTWTNSWYLTKAFRTWHGVTVVVNKVKELNLKMNNLNGTIPDAFFNLPNLTFLHLRGNSLGGAISPHIEKLSKLRFLGLNNNQFTGSLPSEMGNLTLLTEMYLQQNQFSGAIPSSFSNLVNLKYLFLFENNLDELPALTSLNQLLQLNVRDNKLQFDDLEINKNVASGVFTYSPQGLVGVASARSEIQGSNITIQSNVGGTNNTYQWYKNGTIIPAATSANLILNNIQPANAGIYTCKVQNTIITGLTLNCAPVTLTVLPYVITTSPAENITTVTADIPYNVNVGSATITEHGVVLATSSGPTTANIKIASGLTTAGANLVTVSPLSHNTPYYAKAYVVVGGNTVYGNEISFTTLPFGITTSAAINITGSGADVPYNVDYGPATITEHGVVYALTTDPDVTDTKIISGSVANGPHTVSLPSLNQTTTYYAKAYAIESGIVKYGNEVTFTTLEIDHPVLTALYNQTDGDNWTDHTNWLTNADISTWYGLTVVNGRVTKIDLSNNQLTGILPDLSPLTELTDVDVSGNNLQFGDLEGTAGVITALGPKFIYSPQNAIPGSGGPYNMPFGGSIDLSVSCSGTGNTYEWQYWDEWGGPPGWTSAGNTSSTANFTPPDDEKYRCEVTNPSFGLILYTADYDVNVRTDRDILMEFYMHNDGVNWFNAHNWNTSAPIDLWSGVFVIAGRVIALDLRGRNLSGTLFSGLSELAKLEYLDLGYDPFNLTYNHLTGSIPIEWSSLTNLRRINLNGNQLEGNIPAEFLSLSNLEQLHLMDCGLSGEVPNELANLESIFEIILHNNHITYIPNFAPQLEKNNGLLGSSGLDVSENNLEFDDLQRQIPQQFFSPGSWIGFKYDNQAKINEPETITVLTNRDATLTCTTGGTGLIYKWWYSSSQAPPVNWTDLTLSTNADIIGANTATLTIKNMKSAYAGYYYCSVQNNNLNALILERETIHLQEGTFNLNNSIPYWFITTANGASSMHNKIVIPALTSEVGLTDIKVYGYDQTTSDYTDLLTTIPLTGSATGYEFLDVNSNPNVRAYGYKISVVDDLNNESNKSPYQQSVHLAINLGLNDVRNLSWTHYEPGTMVTSYDVLAGNSVDVSTMTSISNLPKFLNTYTDIGTWNYYVIQTNFVPPPTPMKNGEEFRSISNILSTQNLAKMPSQNTILIYPNPAKDIATLTFDNPKRLEYEMKVLNINGQTMLSVKGVTSNMLSFDINELPTGLYLIQLVGESLFMGKMLIE